MLIADGGSMTPACSSRRSRSSSVRGPSQAGMSLATGFPRSVITHSRPRFTSRRSSLSRDFASRTPAVRRNIHVVFVVTRASTLPGGGGMAPSAVLSQTNMNAPNRIASTKTDEIGYNKITIPKMTATVPRNSGTHQCEVIRETPSGLVTDETMLEWYPAAATCLRHGAIACDRQRVSVPRELERASRSGSKLPSSNARATALRSAVVCNVSNAIPVACASSLRTARSSGG